MNSKHRKSIMIGVMFTAILGVIAMLWFGISNVGNKPNQPVVVALDANHRAPKPLGNTRIHTNEPNQPELIESPARTDAGSHSFAVRWLGDAPLQEIRVPVRRREGGETTDTALLSAKELRLYTMLDGDYEIDFALVEIYSPGATITIKSGSATLRHFAADGTEALILCLGKRCELVAELHGKRGATTGHIVLEWWSAEWPARTVAPRHRANVDFDQPTQVVVPMCGIGFSVHDVDYWLISPQPQEFDPERDGAKLLLEFGNMVRLAVEVYENVVGEYIHQLGLQTIDDSAIVLVDVDLVAEDAIHRGARRIYPISRDLQSIERAGNAADQFVVKAPLLDRLAKVDVTVALRGGRIFAFGSSTIAPSDTEVVVQTHIVTEGAIGVTVVDEAGLPMKDVEVVTSLFRVVGGNRMTTAGPDITSRTTDDGTFVLTDLPTQEDIRLTFRAPGLHVLRPSAHVKLTDAVRSGVELVIQGTAQSQMRFRVMEAEGIQSYSYAVLEGPQEGIWHKCTAKQVNGMPVVHSFKDSSKYYILLVRAGNAYFVRKGWIGEGADHELSIKSTYEYFIKPENDGSMYPYELNSSVLYAASMSGYALPFVRLAKGQTSAFRCESATVDGTWRVVTDTGALSSVSRTGGSNTRESPISIATMAEVLGTIEVSLDAVKIGNASNVSLYATPVFESSRIALNADLGLAVRIDVADLDSLQTKDLPVGRYCVMLAYKDQNGHQRFGVGPGGHAIIEVRDGFTTKVHLPVE